MIKTSELRIGNICRIYNETTVIALQDLRFIDSDNNCFKNKGINTNPIPLTEDRLLRFGFKKSDNQYNRFERGVIGVVLLGDNHCVDIYDSYNEIHTSLVLINYLHQLQNLYFALTNEELTLKQ